MGKAVVFNMHTIYPICTVYQNPIIAPFQGYDINLFLYRGFTPGYSQ